jgi:hypothetical protein
LKLSASDQPPAVSLQLLIVGRSLIVRSSEHYETLLRSFAGTENCLHPGGARLGAGGDAQPGFEGHVAVGVEGLELPGPAVLAEEDRDVA